MEHYKCLYKENISVVKSRQLKRRELRDNRTKKRCDMFTSARSLESSSPKPPLKVDENGAEGEPLQPNMAPQVMLESAGNKCYTYRIATTAAKTNENRKLTRAENFLRRYIEWKESKKAGSNNEKPKNRKSLYVVKMTPPKKKLGQEIVQKPVRQQPFSVLRPEYMPTEQFRKKEKLKLPNAADSDINKLSEQTNRDCAISKKYQFPIARKALAPVQPTNISKKLVAPVAPSISTKATTKPKTTLATSKKSALGKARDKLEKFNNAKKSGPKLGTNMKAKRPNLSTAISKTRKINAELSLLKPSNSTLSETSEKVQPNSKTLSFTTGDGWTSLINNSYENLQSHQQNQKTPSKQERKFNFLRFDANVSLTPTANRTPHISKKMPKDDTLCTKSESPIIAQLSQSIRELQDTIVQTLQLQKQKNNITANQTNKFNFLRNDANVSLTDLTPSASRTLQVNTDRTDDEASIAHLTPAAQRTLQAVAHFRQQLAEQISRFHTLCNEWEAYKATYSQRLQETCGMDMIDVTIGQTKLLTSKKFMQFKDLIDRCELGAKGKAAINDGSEKTKPITAIDLDGFWSMLDLQVCNIDKRFKELESWRENNWVEPTQQNEQQIKKKRTKKSTKSNVAAKAKPSAGLQQMLRRLHGEMQKQKQNADGESSSGEPNSSNCTPNTPKVSTGSKSSLHRSNVGTPLSQKRISIVVRDRKSRSIAPTVISIPTPVRQRRSNTNQQPSVLQLENDPIFLSSVAKLKQSISKFRELCEPSPQFSNNNVSNNDSNKSCSIGNMSTNSQLENADYGTYSLRNRSVRLRPSNEIIIPR